MRKIWYARLGEQIIGPLMLEELIAMAADGRLQPSDMVRFGDTGVWAPALKVNDLRFPGNHIESVKGAFSVTEGTANAVPIESSGAVQEEFLDDLEDVMIRMTKGVFLVPFVKFPQLVRRIAVRLFPQFVKAVRVLAWVWVWCLAGFGPAIAMIWTRGELPFELPAGASEHREIIQYVTYAVVVGWTALAGIVGSIYGIGCIKNRRCRKAIAVAERSKTGSVPTA